MNKVVIEGIITDEEGAYVNIKTSEGEVVGYSLSFFPFIRGLKVRAEGFLKMTSLDQNKFYITAFEVLEKDKAAEID